MPDEPTTTIPLMETKPEPTESKREPAAAPAPAPDTGNANGSHPVAVKTRRGTQIVWTDVQASAQVGRGKKKETKQILRGVSGVINPGELVAILGGSGAGKTTLLNALSGRLPPGIALSGTILVDGAKRDRRKWKRQIGYVEQEDLLLSALTTRESLEFAAQLRLPDANYTTAQKSARVTELLQTMGLSEAANTKIGGGSAGGLSGGQKKRLSIAQELVANPATLFLDEPTSGLDAFTSYTLVEGLKALSREGRTILCTLHMPRETIVDMFDKIILMSRGEIIWAGPCKAAMEWFSTLGYPTPPQTNPADHFLDIISVDTRTPALRDASQTRLDKLSAAWKARPDDKEKSDKEVSPAAVNGNGAVADVKSTGSGVVSGGSGEDGYRKWNVPIWKEFLLLLVRDGKATYTNPIVVAATFFQTLCTIILIGIVYLRLDFSQASVQSRSGLLFFISINTTFSALIPVINSFAETRNFIVRERASGSYHVSSAFYAKLFVTIPITILSTGTFSMVVYWMTNLHPDGFVYLKFIVIMVFLALTSMSMGLFIASIAPNVQVATVIAPIFNLVFIVFGGNFANLDSIPVFIRWLQWVSPVKYTYSALMINEFSGLTFDCNTGSPSCFTKGEEVLTYFGIGSISVGVSLLVLIGMSVALQTGALFALRRTTKPNSVII